MWEKIDGVASKFASVLTILSVLAVFILGILQVLFRFVIEISVPWTEELMRALYIYMVFFGVILIERDNTQIRTTMIIERLPRPLYLLWEIIVSAFSILFNVVVFIGSFVAWGETVSTLGSLPMVSMKMFYYPLMIGCPLMALYQVYHMTNHVRALLGKEESK